MSAPANIIRAYDAKIDDVRSDDMSLVCRVNTADVDYYKTVLHPRGIRLDNYNALNRPILWEHGKDVHRRYTDPIGNAAWIRTNGGQNPTEILARPRFLKDDFSRQRWEWYRDGVIKGWSINILPDEGSFSPPTKEELRARPDWESAQGICRNSTLLEFSGTVLPGNPRALNEDHERAVKVMDLVERGMLWLPEEAEPIYREAASRTTVNVPIDLPDASRSTIIPGIGPVLTESEGGAVPDPEPANAPSGYCPFCGAAGMPANDGNVTCASGHVFPAEAARTMTDSLGGLTGGGAAVKPTVKGEDEDEDEEGDEKPDAKPRTAPDSVRRYVRKKGDKWIVYSESGDVLGKHDSKADADGQLAAIEAHKHDAGRSGVPTPMPCPKSAPDPARSAKSPDGPHGYDPPGKAHDPSKFRVVEQDGAWHIVDDRGNDRGSYPSREVAQANLDTRVKEHRESSDDGDGVAGHWAPEPARSAGDVYHDGHGSWRISGFDDLSFPDRSVAERAVALMANPPRFATEWDVVRREIEQRDVKRNEMIVELFELRRYGKV